MKAAALLLVALALAGCQHAAPKVVLDARPIPKSVLDCADAPEPLDPDAAVQADIWPYLDAVATAGDECRRHLRAVKKIHEGGR